jgi:branched-chain amino acid transport system ATP-binding protein
MLSIKLRNAIYEGAGLHISMEVPKGKVVTLIGSNRAGKTTTMRAISGMIKPTAGEINLHGKRIDGLGGYTTTIAKQDPFTGRPACVTAMTVVNN